MLLLQTCNSLAQVIANCVGDIAKRLQFALR
jgi:hypothetical protein